MLESFLLLSRRLQHQVVSELQLLPGIGQLPETWRPADFHSTSLDCVVLYKRSNQLSFIRTGLCTCVVFFTPKSLYQHSVVHFTTHLQWAVDMFYLNFIVVFNQASRKLVSCQIFIFVALRLDPQAQSCPLSGLGLVYNQSGMALLQENSPENDLRARCQCQH